MQEKTKYSQLKENRQHSSVLLPFSLYHCCIPKMYASVPMHWHKEFEINRIIEGHGQVILGEEKHIVSKGDIIIIPPNVLHAAYVAQGEELMYEALVFNHSILGTDSNDRSTVECILPIIKGHLKIRMLIPHTSEKISDFQKCIGQIFACAKRNQPLSDLLLKSELLRFFWLLENDLLLIQKENGNIHYSELILPSLEYMENHYNEKITVERLADICHLSKSYYMWCFNKATGLGAVEHLSQLRMKRVCEMLKSTDEYIADIAYNCGYDNLSNFNRQFKKMIGCTPGQYRNRNR